jgi:hypothetical protein
MTFPQVNIYMNSGFEGGRTRFFDKLRNGTEVAAIKGSAGACLIFMQPSGGAELAHDGEEVSGGLKYLFRSDVMYRRVGAKSRVQSAPSIDALGEAMFHEAECLEASGKYDEAISVYMRLRREHPEFAARYGVV